MLSSDEEDSGFRNGVCFTAGTSKVISIIHPPESENDVCLNDEPMTSLEDEYRELLATMKLRNKAFTRLRKDFTEY